MRCDAPGILRIILSGYRATERPNQEAFLEQVFLSCQRSGHPDFAYYAASRFLRGQKNIAPLQWFYRESKSAETLAADIAENVLPNLADPCQVANEVYNLLMEDSTVSDQKKAELNQFFDQGVAVYVAYVLQFALTRPFLPRK